MIVCVIYVHRWWHFRKRIRMRFRHQESLAQHAQLEDLFWWFQNMYSWTHVSWRFWNIYLSHIKDECHSLYALQLQQKNMWYVLPCYPPLKCRYTWAFIGRLISNFGVISRTPGSHHLRDNRTPLSYILSIFVFYVPWNQMRQNLQPI